MAGANKTCLTCKKEFTPAYRVQEYCSKPCQHETMRGKKLSEGTKNKMRRAKQANSVVKVNTEDLNRLYWECGMSVRQIADLLQVDDATLHSHMRRSGIKLRAQKQSMKTGRKSPNWKGGTYKTIDGYTRLSSGKRRNMLEHRMVAEQILGRKLRTGEMVHHINGMRDDNRNINLLICTRSYHAWLHRMTDIKNNKPLFGRATDHE